MSKAPPVPPEQTSQHGGNNPGLGEVNDPRRSDERGVDERLQSGQPGSADINSKQQGQAGDIHQNTHHQGYQQDR